MDPWMEIVAMAGIALALSVGGTIDRAREWLLGFLHRWNPLRWLGLFLSVLGLALDSTLVTGFLVGAAWRLGEAPWREVLTLGGIAASVTYGVDLLFSILSSLTMLLTRGATMPMAPPPRLPRPEPELTPEEKAWAALDREEETGETLPHDRGGIIPN